METENVTVINPSSDTASKNFESELKIYLGEARSFRDAEIEICRFDTDLVASNVQRGVLAVTEASIVDRIRRELQSVDLEQIRDLPRLAGTVAHVARQVQAVPPRNEEVQKAIDRGFVLRRLFLSQISLMVDCGLVQPRDYLSLRKGRGIIDVANALIDGAEVLTRAESKVGARILLGAELLHEARQVASLIHKHVRPAAAPRPFDSERGDAMVTRDRLWTLLVRRYQVVRRVAWWMWADEAGLHVPSLGSRQLRARRGADAGETPAVNPADQSGEQVAPQTRPQGEQGAPAEPQPEAQGEPPTEVAA